MLFRSALVIAGTVALATVTRPEEYRSNVAYATATVSNSVATLHSQLVAGRVRVSGIAELRHAAERARDQIRALKPRNDVAEDQAALERTLKDYIAALRRIEEGAALNAAGRNRLLALANHVLSEVSRHAHDINERLRVLDKTKSERESEFL